MAITLVNNFTKMKKNGKIKELSLITFQYDILKMFLLQPKENQHILNYLYYEHYNHCKLFSYHIPLKNDHVRNLK